MQSKRGGTTIGVRLFPFGSVAGLVTTGLGGVGGGILLGGCGEDLRGGAGGGTGRGAGVIGAVLWGTGGGGGCCTFCGNCICGGWSCNKKIRI